MSSVELYARIITRMKMKYDLEIDLWRGKSCSVLLVLVWWDGMVS